MKRAIRVLIAEDQALIRAGFRALLDAQADIDVCGEAASGVEAVAVARNERPDIVLMDIRMPDMDGIEATARIAADPQLTSTRIIVLTTFETDQDVFGALRAGASGFLLKGGEPDELLTAVRVVADGESLLAPSLTRRLIEAYTSRPEATRPDTNALSLTERELEVLTLVGQGLNNREIAERLTLSPLTAKTHVSRILGKLGARDRSQLVVTAYETGLVVPGTNP